MNGPPHETHERLNRDLSRLRMRDVGFWGGWSALIAILMLLLILFTNAPRETRFVTGIAGQTMTLQNETRLSVLMRVTVEGRQSDIVFPSQLDIPKIGDEICFRAGEHRLTGRTSYVVVSDIQCEAPSATPSVD